MHIKVLKSCVMATLFCNCEAFGPKNILEDCYIYWKERDYCAISRVFTVEANPTAKPNSHIKTTIFLQTYRDQTLSGLVPQGGCR